MSNNIKTGSVYFDKKDERWKCSYYTIDQKELIEKRKTKSFLTEEEAKHYLTAIQCQKGNSLFIKNNGIPLNELLKTLADNKLEANLIKERSIFKNII